MKRLLGTAVAASLLALAPAYAADIPTKGPIAAPAPIFNWSGFYVGIEGGGVWASTQWTRPSAGLSTGNFTGNGWLIGGTLGYNWQAPGSAIVLGIEGDLSWADVSARTTIASCPGCGTKLEWLGTVRARLGWAMMPQALLFVTGGAAFGGFQHTVLPLLPTFSNRTTEVGWTLGGGIEFMLGRNWSAKAEYLYVDFGSQVACPATSICGAGTVINADYFRTHVVRGGVNYRF